MPWSTAACDTLVTDSSFRIVFSIVLASLARVRARACVCVKLNVNEWVLPPTSQIWYLSWLCNKHHLFSKSKQYIVWGFFFFLISLLSRIRTRGLINVYNKVSIPSPYSYTCDRQQQEARQNRCHSSPVSQIRGFYLSSLCHAKQLRPSLFPHPLSFLTSPTCNVWFNIYTHFRPPLFFPCVHCVRSLSLFEQGGCWLLDSKNRKRLQGTFGN